MKKFQPKPVRLGVEKLLDEKIDQLLAGRRVGLVCNQASVDHNFRHAVDLFYAEPKINLTTLFGPQHGIRGDVQDNMVETAHAIDQQTQLPIYSLYGETRQPTPEMLENVDVVVFDLQDVGCRVYTFIYTMANVMRACARQGKKLIVCDRPNPINGLDVEGNILEPGHESFVGQFPLPMRHGLTIGELARLFRREYKIDCDLEVVWMDNWAREDFYDETDAPWVMPSPNMPTTETALVFPGTVYLEGTQVSEGRGTTRPFEIIGAPFVEPPAFAKAMEQLHLPGVVFRSINFLPTFQKHAGQVCGGVFLHVVNRRSFRPVITGVALIKLLREMYPRQFAWKDPPYEYEFERNPFDVIDGSLQTREMIENGAEIREIEELWKDDLTSFDQIRNEYLFYRS